MTPNAARAQFSFERTYAATIEEVWALWTTKEGIEAWWGPEGFAVTVTSLDLRPKGELKYLMTAVTLEVVEYMERSGMALSTPCTVTYTEVVHFDRLTYNTRTDFVPGVNPYDVATTVDLRQTPDGVLMTITCDAMHDKSWTDRARAGFESQLRKLDTLWAGEGQSHASTGVISVAGT